MAYFNARLKWSLAVAFTAAAADFSLSATIPPVPVANPVNPSQIAAWHLKNPQPRFPRSKEFIDMNIAPLRGSVSGKGCKVAAVESIHPDDKGIHADLVRSLINNQSERVTGKIGIAPDAHVTVFRGEPNMIQQGVLKGQHIINHSHQDSIPFTPNPHLPLIHEYMARNERFGLGAVIFSSAGNHGAPYYEIEKLQPEVMTIGAVDKRGNVAKFSAKGAYVFAVTPGDQIVFNPSTVQNGTSFAAPLAAGAGCLMIEANPMLGYRDAQDIIALTARHRVIGGEPFQKNAAAILNGGGYAFRYGAGFGLIDTYAAVRLAETWDRLSNSENVKTFSAGPSDSGISNAKRKKSLRIAAPDNVVVEHVQIDFSALKFQSTPKFIESNVRFLLTSPSGTSVEIFRARRDPRSNGPGHSITHSAATPYFRGEPANGAWTLSLKSPEGHKVTLDHWSLVIRAREENSRTYFYTGDYLPQGPERTLAVSAGNDNAAINTVAIPDDAILYLNGESDSWLGAKSLRIAPGAVRNAITGDGDDKIFGPPKGGRFFAGRGNDTLAAYGQGNSFVYRAGIDGNDVIVSAPGARGTIMLKNITSAAEILQTRTGNDIVLQFAGKAGSITVRNAAVDPVIEKIYLLENGSVIPVANPAPAAKAEILPSALSHPPQYRR